VPDLVLRSRGCQRDATAAPAPTASSPRPPHRGRRCHTSRKAAGELSFKTHVRTLRMATGVAREHGGVQVARVPREGPL